VVPEAGIEPARLAARDFLPASAFAAGGFSRRKSRRSWAGARLRPGLAAL